ncbi:hypothetical protein AB0933_25380 [Streptomyces venezuelae]|uniref:hypothetical protein n=1 Tax=Streptomyces venezuelae TaxID=54571 RepID=UPI0034546546
MPNVTGTRNERARRSTSIVASVTMALIAVAGCGSDSNDSEASRAATDPKQPVNGSSAAPRNTEPGDAQAAELIEKAIDVTLDQDFLRSTRRMKTEGTTVMHSAVRGGVSTCETHARKGAATLGWVITTSALYTRGSKQALLMSPDAKRDPVRVKVMADRWVKRQARMYEVMRDMCTSKNRRNWLQERLPSMEELRKETPAQRSVTLHGQPATKITYKGKGGPVVFHVAAEGTPFLLRATYPAKDLDESYADFGKRFKVAAPPGAVTDSEIAAEIYAAE